MRGHIQPRRSERTGKTTYRVRVYVGKRDAERLQAAWEKALSANRDQIATERVLMERRANAP